MAPLPATYAFEDDDEDDDTFALRPTENKVTSDMTNVDFEYADSDEVAGTAEIIASLTQEEQKAMPDEFMALRHYRAEKGDVTQAIAKIKATIQWRDEFGADKIANCFDKKKGDEEMAIIISKENETGKMYVRGYDKSGRAVIYMRPGKENSDNEDNNMRHLVFTLEKAIACSQKNKMAKICLIIDYEGFKFREAPPMSTAKRTIHILQHHYPERMHRAYVCNPPMLFKTFWAVIKPFVDPVTKKKICFCTGTKGMEQIHSDMGENAKSLEPCAGGIQQREFETKEYLSAPLNKAFDEK